MLIPLQAGTIIEPYRVIGVLGSGGMGQVYRVEHMLTGRQEAMKVLIGSRLSAGDQCQRFLREIQLQARLSHVNIAAVHHAFWMDDDLVMIMELVEGTTLQSLLQATRISLDCAVNYARQVLDALQHAHEHGVVHRDVTPANILITPGGAVKLTDFGLAKAPRDMRFTQTGAVMGSLHYMSPEQVRGSTSLDERTDLYSLGVVLYEMATGKRPFEAADPFSLMLAHVQQGPPPPLAIDPGIPPALNAIVLTALAKQPERRFSSATEFREALESLGEITRPGRIRRWSHSRLGPRAAMVAVTVTFLVGMDGQKALKDARIVDRTGVELPKPSEVLAEAQETVPPYRVPVVAVSASAEALEPPVESARHPGMRVSSVIMKSMKPPEGSKNAAEVSPPDNPSDASDSQHQNRRSWLRRALGKVVHPRGQHVTESKR